ncbi:MAG TPA: hypothetical protein VMQ11_16810, partial [Alphaproteobacteria bacterium]|nr:hypothetical protein [Alphaproteobacteria bacterium]
FLAAYTFSKSTDDASGAPTNEFAAVAGDQQNRTSNKALSDFDRTHRFVLSGLYELPRFYNGRSGAAKQIVNGWQLGGVLTAQSGIPFSVVCVSGSTLYNRADLLSATNPSLGGSVHSRLNGFFNTSVFSPTCTNTAPFGTSGRNIIRGPNQSNVDLSILKAFPVTERVRIDFRTEFFNTFNRVNFANPSNNVLVPATLGTITSAATGPRVIQFALKVGF